MLEAHGPYLLGEPFTSADLFPSMLTRWGTGLERRLGTGRSSFAEQYHTIKVRPAIQRVFDQEGLDDDS